MIRRNPTRREDRLIDRALYKERHLLGCFINKLKRFRRIVLRSEKSISSFKAFADLECAMARIS